ncbi:MAG: molybdopterin-dependent oxidoreductase, partial [bacterium]|nr:molybdopterin-dependent oxidoreductase [bacterium]
WDVKPTLTTCTQCPVGCSTFADSRFDVLLRTRFDHVSADPHQDPAGDWLCDRGRYNVGFLTDRRRLAQPMVRSGEDQWVDLAWSDAIELVAKTLKDAVAAFGPQSIGAIGGGRLTNEEAYLLQHLVRGLGSANLDYRTHGELTANPGRLAAEIRDLDNADVILEVGADSVEQAPVLDLRVRYAVQHHAAQLAYVGDAKPSWPLYFRHFAAGGDAAAVLNEAAANVRHEEDAPKSAGEAPAVALARLLRSGERIVLIWDGKHAAVAAAVERLIDALRERDKHAGVLVVGHAPNARGAEAMGMHPAFAPGYAPAAQRGLTTEGMLRAAARGELKALLVFGANPLLSYPDGALVRAALERLPFLVSADLFMTGTALRSHVALPVRSGYEKAGHTTALDGTVKRVQVASQPQNGEPLSDREILFLLADAAGVAIPDESELEQAAATLPGAAAQRSLAPSAAAFAVDAAVGGGEGEFVVCALPRLYAGGGTSAHDDALAALRPRATAFVNRGDAERLGLDDGDVVELRNAHGALGGLEVETGERVPAGYVGVIAELPEAPANAISGGVGGVRAGLRLVSKGERATALAGAKGA